MCVASLAALATSGAARSRFKLLETIMLALTSPACLSSQHAQRDSGAATSAYCTIVHPHHQGHMHSTVLSPHGRRGGMWEQ
jgi:hypothetical protein